MPGLVASEPALKKRKRQADTVSAKEIKARKAVKLDSGNDIKTRIIHLEERLSQPEERERSLAGLLSIAKDEQQKVKTAVLAAVTLCRGYCRLIAGEELIRTDASSAASVDRLKANLALFADLLQSWIGNPDMVKENAAVTLLMRIIKEEASQDAVRAEQAWRQRSRFQTLVRALLTVHDAAAGRQLFVEKYVEEHDDVRYYTFLAVKQILAETEPSTEQASSALELLGQIEGIPQSQDQLEDWFGRQPEKKHTLLSLNAHFKVAQEAWLAVFRSPLTAEHRKTILDMLRDQLMPWFANKLEVLTDFLTDSFNTPGNTAVLALDGIFHLITERNIDYPDFYVKLYSLLDDDILHSRHRSPFLRLLEKCMASTHLPAAMVASFMKRLARLALQAPPGAVVWLVPWTYNMLRQHPSCTFMLHRTEHPSHAINVAHPKPEETGMEDPFDMQQRDPMLTGALDSSLWELQTLMSHYHPNVATLASILGEQFTKREYQLEDFLDHSYNTLLDNELSRELKKEPVVEWEIPKHIVTASDGSGELNSLGGMLQAAIDVL